MGRQALGRGIGALIPAAGSRRAAAAAAAPAKPERRESAEGSETPFEMIPIESISPNPRQPRQRFDEESLAELAASIRESGLLQPVVVRRVDGARYELIAGERRLRACRLARLREVPAIVRDATDRDGLALAIVENVHRADLDPIEEAQAYRALIEEFSLTQAEVARRVGRSRPAVANALRLLQLPPQTQAEVAAGRVSPGHARALLSVEGAAARDALAREVVKRNLNVRDTEREAARRRGRAAVERDPDVERLEGDLMRALGTRVRIALGRGAAGRLEIEFLSADDLAQLADRLLALPPARRARAGR